MRTSYLLLKPVVKTQCFRKYGIGWGSDKQTERSELAEKQRSSTEKQTHAHTET